MLKFQVEYISKNDEEFQKILAGIDLGPDVIQIVPAMLSLILANRVYEKFGLEEEDYMKNLEDILSKP
jgi:hypothetical protein